MAYEVRFGSIGKPPRATASPGQKFRLALLGDFSGRANAGRLEIGPALANRQPIKVDVDNLDTVIARMGVRLRLDLSGDGTAIEVPIAAIDDFHPDQLVDNIALFDELRGLRKNLGSRAGFDRAAKEVLSWSGALPLPPAPRQARGAMLAKDKKLSDFARLTGRPARPAAAEAAAEDLLRRILGPLVVPARDARQDQLLARVDESLSETMRRVLHHPDFQSAEALWRGVEFLVRRIETDYRCEIVLYDVSAEELAADLAGTDTLEETGLFGLLAEQPLLDAHQGAISAVAGLYGFDLTPPHADLLGRVAQIAAAAGAPFIAAVAPDALKSPLADQHPLIKDAWSALRALPASAYLGLVTPRFLLRLPYGKKTDPIDAFAFEEFTRQSGLRGMLWGHAALIPAFLLAESFKQQGNRIKLGAIMGVGDIPYFVYTDQQGDQTALPCTERLYSDRQAVQVNAYGVMPLICLRGRPELRLASFASVLGRPLAGFWAPVDIQPTAAPVPPQGRAASSASPAFAGNAAVETQTRPEQAATVEEPDLDALLASLSGPSEAAVPAVAPPVAGEAAPDPIPAAEPSPSDEPDLDALLASLSADIAPPAADETDADLDALLASLK
jgi:type VI secretion system protein ImpC